MLVMGNIIARCFEEKRDRSEVVVHKSAESCEESHQKEQVADLHNELHRAAGRHLGLDIIAEVAEQATHKEKQRTVGQVSEHDTK